MRTHPRTYKAEDVAWATGQPLSVVAARFKGSQRDEQTQLVRAQRGALVKLKEYVVKLAKLIKAVVGPGNVK